MAQVAKARALERWAFGCERCQEGYCFLVGCKVQFGGMREGLIHEETLYHTTEELATRCLKKTAGVGTNLAVMCGKLDAVSEKCRGMRRTIWP